MSMTCSSHCQAELLHFARTAFNAQSKELQMFALLIAMRVEALDTLEPLKLDEDEKTAMLAILQAWRRQDRRKQDTAYCGIMEALPAEPNPRDRRRLFPLGGKA